MSVIEAGKLTQVSVSQVEAFTRCGRRWWFERAKDLRPDQTPAQTDGEAGHALLALHFRGLPLPEGRHRMKKHVTAAIVSGRLPKPGPDMLVEERLSGQPRLDAEGTPVPLDTSATLWLGGLPWEGYIDLAYRRQGVPVILDHKFAAAPRETALASADLIQTVQLPIYVLAMARRWTDAQEWCIAHHYIAKTGIDSFIRSARVTMEQVARRGEEVAAQVQQMCALAGVAEQADVPYRRSACLDYGGCPHQSICIAYRNQEKATVEFTQDELSVFGPPPAPKPRLLVVTDDTPAPVAEPQAVPVPEAPPPPPVNEVRCDCGATLTPENSSRLRSGALRHVGCALMTPPPPAQAPKPRARKAPPAPPATAAEAEVPRPALPPAAAPVAAAARGVDPLAVAELLESIARMLRG